MSEDETPREVKDPRAETASADTQRGNNSKPKSTSTNSSGSGAKRRRRGSRGGRKRSKARRDGSASSSAPTAAPEPGAAGTSQPSAGSDEMPEEMPERLMEGRPSSVDAAAEALVRKPSPQPPASGTPSGRTGIPKVVPPGAPSKPKIGDTLPAPPVESTTGAEGKPAKRKRRGKGRGKGTAPEADAAAPVADDAPQAAEAGGAEDAAPADHEDTAGEAPRGRPRRRRRGGRRQRSAGKDKTGSEDETAGEQPVEAAPPTPVELDEDVLEQRRGRQRKGRPVGRYLMCVHVTETASQIAVLEGRSLIEHYVSRRSDDVTQIHGNIYLGRVQNVLPGMEAAFVDIGTPKNAVLYRGDVQYDPEDVEEAGEPRIETVLKAGQTILCQVTKNPIGAKGARLTQEVSLPGRHVVLIPNSRTYGISKRLRDEERRRLRQVLDRVKPAEHGMIVRTAAEGATAEEIEADVERLVQQWRDIDRLAKRSRAPTLLYREPEMAVRVIREEFNQDYRGIVIDDPELYEAVRDYVRSINSTLADRVQLYDLASQNLPLFERHHVHEQVHRALDRKVWLPSGGSLIIEHTEALTVIDVNTGKNVGRSSLEETVFKNNLEAAVETARQLRLRDIGGIIVVDFIDMERKGNRDEVVRVFREALARDKTRTQVFDISELGLCEMTRKRIGEGLLESYSTTCPTCQGRGLLFDEELLSD